MTRVPDRLVEKVHLGEATAAERALVEADPDARARLAALPAQDVAFFAAHPVDETLRAIEGRARIAAAKEAAKRPSRGWLLWAPAMATAAAVFLVIASDGPQEASRPLGAAQYEAAKGSPHLLIYRERREGPERLVQGAVAAPGDTLQVGVLGAGARFGVVVSVDGRGSVTLHWPEKPTGSTKLKSGEHRLDHAYQLDDAPKFERFFLVTSDGQTDVDAVMAAARTLAASGDAEKGQLSLPTGYSQASTLLRKVN